MSAEEIRAEQGEIQLHFCQRCGISIPVSDVISGHAQPAPGGYVCGVCRIEERAPSPAAPSASPLRRDASSRLFASLALLYVVGATSYLLYREVTRQAPVIELPPMAMARDLDALDKKLEALDRQSRAALAALGQSSQAQGEQLAAVRKSLLETDESLTAQAREALERDKNLLGAIDAIGERTGVLRSDLSALLDRQMEDLRRELATLRAAETQKGDAPAPPPPAEAKRDPKQTEQARLLADLIARLASKESTDRARFSAASQMGDLKDPAAVDPLVLALTNDPSELVKRGAAWSLGRLGKQAVRAIPALIAQVGSKEEYVGYTCDRALSDISQDALGARVTFGYDPTLDRKRRQAIQKQWEEWWQKNRETLAPGAPGAMAGR